MNFAHTNQKSLDRIDIVDEMEGKKGNVYIFPSDWLDQIKHGLTKFDHIEVIHAENLC